MEDNLMEKIVALCKRRGFIYPGSDIYGGLANTYDYGPLGAQLLRNIREVWWLYFVQFKPDMVGLDASIISHHKVWEASGHVAGFADAMIDCKNCKARMRADHLIEDWLYNNHDKAKEHVENLSLSGTKLSKETINKAIEAVNNKKVEGFTLEMLSEMISIFSIKCPNCGAYDWTTTRKFNLLFPVQLGIVEGEGGEAYLRGETAQGTFINFKNVVDSTRVKLPFGIAQIGKSFRNEITPGNSIFRTIEFEQGEIEYFFNPKINEWQNLFDQWKEDVWKFVTVLLHIKKENLKWREHDDKERSFYSKKTEDLEYKFPFGFKELWGLAYRTNYDLTQHMEFSQKDLTITDPNTNEKILPHAIEPAVGINRLLLMILVDAYTEEENRVLLKISSLLAPYKVAIFPLLANKPELVDKARELYNNLRLDFMVVWDDRGNIGKRYLSQDEAGTPWCVTIDFQTLGDGTVTIRDRDTTEQERIKIDKVSSYVKDGLYRAQRE